MLFWQAKLITVLVVLLSIFCSIQTGIIFGLGVWAIHSFLRVYSLLPKKNIEGKHILITGGAMGIGKELAIQLSQYKPKITLLDLNEQEGLKTVQELKKLGLTNAQFFQCDVRDDKLIKQLFQQAEKSFGDIDILINNAGVVSGLRLSENTFDKMALTLDVNTRAHFATILAVFDKMVKKNSGHIVSISSMAGWLPSAGLIDYNASKYGVVGIHESLTQEIQQLDAWNVKTTLICPWFLKTNMTVDVDESVLFGVLELKPAVKRMVDSILQDEFYVMIPFKANFLIYLKQLLPYQVYLWLVYGSNKMSLQKTYEKRLERLNQDKKQL